MTKLIVAAALILSILAGVAFWAYTSHSMPTEQTGPTELTYWGFEEEIEVLPIIDEYQKLNSEIKISYSRQGLSNYKARVQTQIENKTGPDIFKIHNSWLPLFLDSLSPAPKEVFTTGVYQQEFSQIAYDSFVKDDQILAVPSIVDGLALYVNTDITQAAGVGIPKSWDEFISGAVKITVKDTGGQIKTAGAALGTASNVDFWSDIIGLLLLQQPGVDLNNLSSPQVSEVLSFYTSFITDPRKKTWDTNLPSSTQLFTAGQLAFYFAPSSLVAQIKQMSPNLKFQVAAVPQLPGRQIGWGSFWGEAVSRNSHQKEAWKFAKFLAEKDLGKQALLSTDPLYGPFISQGAIYKFWYLSSIEDGGINDEEVSLWQTGITQVLAGQSPQVVIQDLAPKSKKILEKYNVVK